MWRIWPWLTRTSRVALPPTSPVVTCNGSDRFTNPPDNLRLACTPTQGATLNPWRRSSTTSGLSDIAEWPQPRLNPALGALLRPGWRRRSGRPPRRPGRDRRALRRHPAAHVACFVARPAEQARLSRPRCGRCCVTVHRSRRRVPHRGRWHGTGHSAGHWPSGLGVRAGLRIARRCRADPRYGGH